MRMVCCNLNKINSLQPELNMVLMRATLARLIELTLLKDGVENG